MVSIIETVLVHDKIHEINVFSQGDATGSLAKIQLCVDTERALVDAQQMSLHIVTSTKNALTNWTPGLTCMQVLVQCQRHRMLETFPTNSTAKQ